MKIAFIGGGNMGEAIIGALLKKKLCLPADISGVSCAQGEVQDRVFERYRMETYQEAGYKPYIIAAMILAGKFADPASVLEGIAARAECRIRI